MTRLRVINGKYVQSCPGCLGRIKTEGDAKIGSVLREAKRYEDRARLAGSITRAQRQHLRLRARALRDSVALARAAITPRSDVIDACNLCGARGVRVAPGRPTGVGVNRTLGEAA